MTTTRLQPTAAIEPSLSTRGLTVWADWSAAGVDRPRTHGISVGSDEALARRLAAAIDAGLVFADPRIATDTGGHTYVAATCRVMGRYLRSDLERLGA